MLYRQTHVLLDDLPGADTAGTRKEFTESLGTVPPLSSGDFAVCELLLATAEDLPEIIMRRYELASTPHTFNLSAEDCN